MSPSTRAATAYHEAGHAGAAIFQGVSFRHVSIKPDHEAAGHIAYLRPVKAVEAMHKRGMIAMAGEAAQRRFNPRSIRRHHGQGDRETVVSFALDSSGSSEQASLLVRLWGIQAREFVQWRCWPSIERVAAELLKRETLTQDDVRGLVFPQYPSEYRRIPTVPA